MSDNQGGQPENTKDIELRSSLQEAHIKQEEHKAFLNPVSLSDTFII